MTSGSEASLPLALRSSIALKLWKNRNFSLLSLGQVIGSCTICRIAATAPSLSHRPIQGVHERVSGVTHDLVRCSPCCSPLPAGPPVSHLDTALVPDRSRHAGFAACLRRMG